VLRITLVNPQIHYTGWFAFPQSYNPNTNLIRLGIAYLSSTLKQFGHVVFLIDLRLMKDWNHFDALLIEQKPDIVGVSMHTLDFDCGIECCRRVKKIFPQVKTVAGGIHPTIDPDSCINSGFVDYVLRGEGEITFPRFCKSPEKFPQVFYGEMPALDLLPLPDRELCPDYQRRIMFDSIGLTTRPFEVPQVDIITKRGCPWQCRFCCGPGEKNLYTRLLEDGRRVPAIRSHSVQYVMKELEELYQRYQFKSIFFHNDQFFIDPKWVEEFIIAFQSAGFVKKGILWACSVRTDTICRFEDVIVQMKNAGCNLFLIGFESFSQPLLDFMNKGTTVEQNFKAANICKKLGIQIYANYILGMPREDGWHREDDIATINAIKKIKPDHCSPSYFTPVPGSWLYNWCIKNNLIINTRKEYLGKRDTLQHGIIKRVDYGFLERIVFTSSKPSFRNYIENILRRFNLYKPARFIYRKIKYHF
jgi:anaerobic magnesium-protoporphyrin IX monomethyl ester cyclase